jgi:hypothetical protein
MFRLFSSLDTIVLTEKKSNLVRGSLVLVVEDDYPILFMTGVILGWRA